MSTLHLRYNVKQNRIGKDIGFFNPECLTAFSGSGRVFNLIRIVIWPSDHLRNSTGKSYDKLILTSLGILECMHHVY